MEFRVADSREAKTANKVCTRHSQAAKELTSRPPSYRISMSRAPNSQEAVEGKMLIFVRPEIQLVIAMQRAHSSVSISDIQLSNCCIQVPAMF